MCRAQLVTTALVLAALPALGELPEHPATTLGGVPAWVEPRELRLDDDEEGAGTAMRYLLVDRQVRVPSAGPPEEFSRLVYRIASRGGLEEGSSWEVDFDPSYERIVFHELRVYRGGEWEDRLERSRSSLLHREEDLHRQVFDQRLTLLLILDDVRVGDIVAVAYTVVGSNPVFQPYFTASYALRWSTEVDHSYLRLVSAPGRNLAHRVHGDAPEGEERRRRDGWNELVWDEHGVPGIDYEDYAPPYFVQYAFVQVSEIATWDEVVEWAAPLYLDGVPPAELFRVAEEIRAAHATPAERIVAARDWVQDEVRYFSVVMGEHSHSPHDTAEVLRRRYGDCKDKSVLLAQLLWLLKIEAAPAFVSTELGRRVADYLPDPTVFDHAIVVAFYDGGEVWIDPTLTHQGGALGAGHRLYVPPYELGLVVGRVDVSGLRPVPEAQSAPGPTTARYVYEVGPERKASVSITTTYRDDGAEGFRELLASQSPVEILEGYVEAYAGDRFKVEPIGDLEVEDDLLDNQLRVAERYRLRYQDAGEEDATSFETLPLLLSWELEEPPGAERRTPFAVSGHPSRYREEVAIFTDDDVELHEVEAKEENPWFEFHVSSSRIREGGRRGLEITYELRTLAGEVAPADVGDYAAAVKLVTDNVGYVVRDTKREDLRMFAVLALAAAALYAGLLCTLVLFLMRRWGFLR